METITHPKAVPASALLRLKRMAARPRAPVAEPEHCALCSAPLEPIHPHVLATHDGRLICACRACALLFSGRTDGAYLAVPDQVVRLADFSLTDAQWQALGVPIDLAFLIRQGDTAIAYYPSPAGATEAHVQRESWNDIVTDNPQLAEFRPRVEALLINRLFSPRRCFRAPIDLCYQLVGLVRVHWRGLSGGTEVWKQVQAFFADLETRAQPGESRASAARPRHEGAHHA